MNELLTVARRALRGQMGAYFQFGVVLFLLAGLVFAVLSMSGCGDCNTSTFRYFGSNHVARYASNGFPIQGRFGMRRADDGEVRSGSVGLRQFRAEASPPGTQFTWTPPRGAANFVFAPDHPPLPGGPPFVWDGIPAGGFDVQFNYPSLPPGAGETTRTDTFEARSAAGDEGYVGFSTVIYPGGGGRLSAGGPDMVTARSAEPSQTEFVWSVNPWLDPAVVTLTTPLCQDLVDWLQSDSVYLATRLPVSATQAVTEAYPLPIYITLPPSSTLQLLRHSPTTSILTKSLELRQAGSDFAETYLPAAPGERWVALGVSAAEPAVCPPGLDLPPRSWSLSARYLLDLSHVPDNCADCLLPTYYCYQGQDLPPIDGLREGTLLASVQAASFPWSADLGIQADGTTCLGPELTHLHDTSSWVLGGVGGAQVQPSQVISLRHFVYVPDTLGSLEVNLGLTSTLDVAWELYGGTSLGPDLGQPLSATLTGDGFQYIWLVSAPVPTSVLTGSYTAHLSATAVLTPADVRWVSDQIWVGGWQAPPPPLAPGARVYLPLVLRQP